MKKLSIFIPLLIVFGAIVILLIPPHRSPIERAFDGAIDAANSHDYARFCQYVDVNGLVKSYITMAHKWGDNSFSENQSGAIDELTSQVQYFIETQRIPDPDRFKKVISTRIAGKSAEALIALELKKYSIVCTTSVMLRSSLDAGWQITRIDLWSLWSKCRETMRIQHSLSSTGNIPTENFSPEEMIGDILFDNYH